MHIRQLRIQNLACFDDVTLDFTDDKGEPCRWVVLLGENGTGKTTALRAIVSALPMEVAGPLAQPDTWFRKWLRTGSCTVNVAAGSDPGDQGHTQRILDWRSGIVPQQYGQNRRVATMGIVLGSLGVPPRLPIDAGWFIAAYRHRAGTRSDESDEGLTSFAAPAAREERTLALFDLTRRLTPIREWLVDLDFRRLKEIGHQEREGAAASYRAAVNAIERVVPNGRIKIVEVTPFKDVIVEEEGVRISIDSLSDGYQSAMNWIGDLVRRLVEAFPNMENPLEAHGVVLVDEIDLHLHPRWQRTIVDQIRTVFPNMQFIVTTHSPFIAQDMTAKDKLIVLKREGDHVTAVDHEGYVEGWRVDQILTSYLFGLPQTRGRRLEEAELAQRQLLDKEAQNGLMDNEKARLQEVRDLIARVKSAPGERPVTKPEEAELKQAANDILAILSRRRTIRARPK